MRILLVPETERGRGSGHVRRAIHLLDEIPQATLFLAEADARVLSLLTESARGRVIDEIDASLWDLVVLDRFSVAADELPLYADARAVVGIDVGGPGREMCDYVIDTLPRLDSSPANVSDRALLRLPALTAPGDRAPGSVLVTYGGEDPARLTETTVDALLGAGVPPDRITVIVPTMRAVASLPPGLRRFKGLPSLRDVLRANEWVFTSFGMTAWEAANSGCRIVTVAPTPYHDRLAAQERFVRIDPGKLNARSVRAAMSRPDDVLAASMSHAVETPRSLAGLITGLEPPARRGSPVAGEPGRAVWRDEQRSYFRCATSSLLYMERFRADRTRYDSAYFDEDYRAQYGKSYLEDFEHIKAMGHARTERIARRVRPPARLLDVGCAYGPFLSAANDAGYDVCGIDVGSDPVRYVNDTLGLNAVCGSILDDEAVGRLPHRQFDVVTLWYVIEHFPQLDELLHRLTGLLRPGGTLAFSTPHGRGVSARQDLRAYLDKSPGDHYTIWDRPSARRVLGSFGYRSVRFRITGHHPQRYRAVQARRLPATLAAIDSRLRGLGDTFEVYATKDRGNG